MLKKAQTATEYLIILAIVIVIALVVVGVLGGIPGIGGGASENANLVLLQEQKIGIQNYAVSANGTTLFLKNNNAGLITVETISINNSDYSMSITLRPGQIKEVSLAFSSSAEGQYRYPISLTYTESKTGASYTIYSDLYLIGTVSDTSGSSGGSGGLGGASLFETSSTDCYGEDSDSDSYYDICTCDDLNQTRNNASLSFELLYDIDFSTCDSSYTTGLGWAPVDSFSGILNGSGNVIYNLYINRPASNDVALFGQNFGGSILDLGLVYPEITGSVRVGALVGRSAATTALINNSYSSGGTINGTQWVGGFVGWFSDGIGTIENSYAANYVPGSSTYRYCFAADYDVLTNSFCDEDVATKTGFRYHSSPTTQSTDQMQSSGQYLGAGWDFESTWVHDQGSGYPKLYGEETVIGIGSTFEVGSGSIESPFQISNCYQLQRIGTDLDAYYELSSDIDCSTLSNGAGFDPIDYFTGQLNGGMNTISNLYINLPSLDNIGLFGNDFRGVIQELGVINPDVTGDQYVGALVGRSDASGSGALINNSYSSGGIINGSSSISFSGGLVGGFSDNAGDVVSNSYAANYVPGNINYNYCLGGAIRTMVNLYCDEDITGWTKLVYTGGATQSTAEMQQEATYSGWDFSTIWQIDEGSSYPYFR